MLYPQRSTPRPRAGGRAERSKLTLRLWQFLDKGVDHFDAANEH
jgi:hypothetical protein